MTVVCAEHIVGVDQGLGDIDVSPCTLMVYVLAGES